MSGFSYIHHTGETYAALSVPVDYPFLAFGSRSNALSNTQSRTFGISFDQIL